jgi:hypothetical protein
MAAFKNENATKDQNNTYFVFAWNEGTRTAQHWKDAMSLELSQQQRQPPSPKI